MYSSGIVEGLNNKVKLTLRKAYGFRTLEAAEIALYHARFSSQLVVGKRAPQGLLRLDLQHSGHRRRGKHRRRDAGRWPSILARGSEGKTTCRNAPDPRTVRDAPRSMGALMTPS